MATYEDAEQTVREALGDAAASCDVPAATKALHVEFGTYDLHEAVYGTSNRFTPVAADDEVEVSARETRFWGVVERFRSPA